MTADILYTNTQDWKRDGRLHAGAWTVIAFISGAIDLTYFHRFLLTKFLITMAAIAVLHELCHVLVAKILHWHTRFLFGRKTYWQPAVVLDPPGPLYASEYTKIALAPVLPTMFFAYWIGGTFTMLVALWMCTMDMKFLILEHKRERGVAPFMQRMPGREVTA